MPPNPNKEVQYVSSSRACAEAHIQPLSDTTALLTMPGDYGFLLRDSLNEPIIQGVSQNASRFLDPPQAGNPGWGSIRSWLARIARNFFSAIKEKAMRGYARLGKY